jgi:hypothetical protein
MSTSQSSSQAFTMQPANTPATLAEDEEKVVVSKRTLGDYPHIVRRLQHYSDNDQFIIALHQMLFADGGETGQRIAHIFTFSGLDETIHLEKWIKRLVDNLHCTRKFIREALYVLGCSTSGTKIETIEKLLTFLISPRINQFENEFFVLPISAYVEESTPSLSTKLKVKTEAKFIGHMKLNRKSAFWYYTQLTRFDVLKDAVADSLTDNDVLTRLKSNWKQLRPIEKDVSYLCLYLN